MARNEQLIRQHKILQILENSRLGKTLEELRDDLVAYLGLGSLHPRSVRRDLEALQAAGIDVGVHTERRGRVWKLGSNFRGTHEITASATELISLSLSRDLLLPLVGTPFWSGLESFWNKLRESLPEAVWKHYQEYRQSLRVHGMPAKNYERWQGMLSTINRAVSEHRVVEIEYQSLGKPLPSRRQIEPYGVVLYQSSIYIIAGAHAAPAAADEGKRTARTPAKKNDGPASAGSDGAPTVLHLKLDRFRKATALDLWFKPPAKFDLAQHLRESVGIFSSGGAVRDFRIRISPFALPWVQEDPWHEEQKLETLPEGGAILTVRAAHELDIIPRVLALGAEAEVLSPASCRKAIAKTVKQLVELYGKE